MKKIIPFIFICILIVLCAAMLFACNKTEYYEIQFIAQEGGYIEGAARQTVQKHKNSSPVTAIAKNDYYFIGWADTGTDLKDESITRDTRVIENVQKNQTYIAFFEKKYVEPGPLSKTYKYHYKYADKNCETKEITMTEGHMSQIKLPVPERNDCIFGGWYADKYYTTQVADINGNLLIDESFLNTDCTQFYAKWTTQNTNTFKLLLIYVTEIKADLPTRQQDKTVHVNYKLNNTELKICNLITKKLNWFLNDLAVGNFQVDEYYTTAPITTACFKQASSGPNLIENSLMPYDIPEVAEIIKEYDSVLVSFNLNDYDYVLHGASGAAQAKYGNINFESIIGDLKISYRPIENLLDENYYLWDSNLGTYLHELAHSIEQRISAFDLHTVLRTYNYDLNEPETCALYFTNKAEVDGNFVGIPYEFWEGKIHKAIYAPSNNFGYIYNDKNIYILDDCPKNGTVLHLLYGQKPIGVTAVPYSDEYEFIKWSDGVETAYRQDFNLTKDIYVYAIFGKKETKMEEQKNEN